MATITDLTIGSYYIWDWYSGTLPPQEATYLRNRKSKSPVIQGDHFRATPYYHSTITEGPAARFYHRWYKLNNGTFRDDRIEREIGPVQGAVVDFGLWSDGDFKLIRPNSAILNNTVLERLNDVQVEAGVALIEARETVSWLAYRVANLFGALVNVKRGRFDMAMRQLGIKKNYRYWKDVSRRSKRRIPLTRGELRNPNIALADTISSFWLENAMAIQPFINDAHDAYNYARNGYPDERKFIVAKAKIGFSEDRDFTGSGSLTRSYEYSGHDFMKVYAAIFDDDLLRQKAIGMNNPAYIAWNGVPFSFLIDYLLPIGEFLNAAKAADGLTFIDGYQSRRLTCSGFTAQDSEPNWSLRKPEKLLYRTPFTYDCYQRWPLTSFPLPSLRLDLGVKPKRFLNVLAIVHQLFK